MTTARPKRLIEVDLPIREISTHARREKSLRHGHISTLHIWWARRPLGTCRAVACAALWPDPADPACPDLFREGAERLVLEFGKRVQAEGAAGLVGRRIGYWTRLTSRQLRTPPAAKTPPTWEGLRKALIHFIADFANWDATSMPAFTETARALTAVAHSALSPDQGSRPTVIDPFAGGGSFPLEALRLGADSFASDLNPVAVLLNRVLLEEIPRHRAQLAAEVRKWGAWMRERASEELKSYFPLGDNGETSLAYIWARTVLCEGPGCGATVPLVSSRWLAHTGRRSIRFEFAPQEPGGAAVIGKIEAVGRSATAPGTIRMGSATCLRCGFSMPRQRVRAQLAARRGGGFDPMLLAVLTSDGEQRSYRAATPADHAAVAAATAEIARRVAAHPPGNVSLLPDELLPREKPWRHNPIWVDQYGMRTWGDLFTPREALTLSVFSGLIQKIEVDSPELQRAVRTCLALAVDRLANSSTSLSRWNSAGEKIEGLFSRQAINILWDFAEPNPFAKSSGAWDGALEWVAQVCDETFKGLPEHLGHAVQASSTAQVLSDDTVAAVLTDPPYYDAVPYSTLSDFFYVWLKRMVGDLYPDLFGGNLVPKALECVVDEGKGKDQAFFHTTMTQAMSECRRVLAPDGICVVVFAHKSTEGWEAQIQALVDAGWVVTGSWPVDTERSGRLRALGSAALGSSVHIVCRPREDSDGQVTEQVGDWRTVLAELPQRIHAWLPRLRDENIVGADAIFACLGPALEVFSRYKAVVKISGEVVPLREFLEAVWESVSKEALSMILTDSDTGGLEEDARLTAMWLWTLVAPEDINPDADDDGGSADDDADAGPIVGFPLEYDAARKISQGLGIHLERLDSVVEVTGKVARLKAVKERSAYLFGKQGPPAEGAAPKPRQQVLFQTSEGGKPGEPDRWGDLDPITGRAYTTLDRVHQAMILFAAGRSEALKRLVVDDGVGRDPRFWKLASALAPLYPRGCDERRWVEGLLGRKKALGFV